MKNLNSSFKPTLMNCTASTFAPEHAATLVLCSIKLLKLTICKIKHSRPVCENNCTLLLGDNCS